MVDEHELHPDVIPVVAGSLQHLQDDEQQRATKRAQETKMRRVFAVAVASAVILASLGAVMMSKHNDAQRVAVANAPSGSGATVSGTDIDARRTDLLRRIDDARNDGRLKGVIYMALLGEHQSLLVAQRRAEAHGMPDADVRQLNAKLDHISGQLERHLKGH
jgi:hypothetical protein